jgi:hypothetical protein
MEEISIFLLPFTSEDVLLNLYQNLTINYNLVKDVYMLIKFGILHLKMQRK